MSKPSSFCLEQAGVFKIGPAEQNATLGKRHPEPEHRQVNKAVHYMSATVKDRLRCCKARARRAALIEIQSAKHSLFEAAERSYVLRK